MDLSLTSKATRGKKTLEGRNKMRWVERWRWLGAVIPYLSGLLHISLIASGYIRAKPSSSRA
jgi:hypothetical protein